MLSSVLTGITSAVLGRNSIRSVGGHAFWKVINIPPITSTLWRLAYALALGRSVRAQQVSRPDVLLNLVLSQHIYAWEWRW